MYSVLTGLMIGINVSLIGSVDDVIDPTSTSPSDTGIGRRMKRQHRLLGVDVDGGENGDNTSSTALV